VKQGQAEIEKKRPGGQDVHHQRPCSARVPNENNTCSVTSAQMKGLYGNSLEEAWYGGYICDGSKPSTVHFSKGDLPPQNSSGR